MALVYLGLGTNIGNKRKNMVTAAALLAERAQEMSCPFLLFMRLSRGDLLQRIHS